MNIRNPSGQARRRATPTHLITVAGVALCAMPLTGCNTIEGAGEDIESAGGAIEETAGDSHEYGDD